ncbi:MAG: flagellin [Alphaproteobacteria bacterium]|nr:flagellin [Alphaproteobacteria bacterium]
MRISTAAASQSALMDLMKSQREAFDAREQLSSGKKAADLKGYANSAETIMTARAAQVRADGFIDANKRLTSRLEVQDLAYRELSDAASELRTALTTTEGTALMNDVRAAFDKVVSALSTKFAGSFVFSGVRTDSPPLNASTLAELQAAAPDVSAVFENADRRQTAQIDGETVLEVNRTASEVAGGLMAVFERLADFDQGPNGPFDGPMDATQQAYIQTEIANVIDAFDTINDAMAENGSKQARIEASIRGHQERSDYLTQMIADLEDADMAEAATRLTQAQTAVEVSARTFASLSQVSLLPFLR